ncbi:MAG: transposase, partial [Chloroflexota bacterium]|nr:transposase [Chloroflexota bacterium]
MNTRNPSYFGNYLYDQMVPQNHFLRLLNEIIEWERFTQHLIELDRGGGEYGRSPLKSCPTPEIDSVHSEARVNTAKDHQRKEGGKGPHDPDAKWEVKGKKKVKNQKGQTVDQVKYFYGYKGHVSMNAESKLITSLEVTSGEAYDGHHFCSLVDQDLAQKLPVHTYTADRGYDDGNNHFYLEQHQLQSAI